MNNFQKVLHQLRDRPRTWLVTGCAGFIGSNLVEFLLSHNQRVIGIDNFSTGQVGNLEDVREQLSAAQWGRFRLLEADIQDMRACRLAVEGVNHVLHHAGLGSVPRSLFDPATTIATNVGGFLNMLIAARDENVESFVYAASSSTYDDHPGLPKREDCIGKPLSPFAVTTFANELYAEVFARSYGLRCVGLRYFNIFGKRQDPAGAHAAVIPKWIAAMAEGRQVLIHGDGSCTRDFCHVSNAIQANILASIARSPNDCEVYNVAVNDATSLNGLYRYLQAIFRDHDIEVSDTPGRAPFRVGDVRHSRADIAKIMQLLGYEPQCRVYAGLEATVPWYLARLRKPALEHPHPAILPDDLSRLSCMPAQANLPLSGASAT